MNKKFLKKGNGEFIGFTIIALVIVMLFIPMCAIFKLALGLYDVNKMLMASSRAAAVCTSMDDAQKQAELVAETTSDNSSVEQIETEVKFNGFENVKAGIVKWPMSVIRITSEDKLELVELANKILTAWRGYTDEDSFIYAETDGEKHNTITPIARMRDGKFELDLVLRNNITTKECPLGFYHPHPEYHHIKRENIGLIEVMGLAVLPSRLKGEMALLKDAMVSGKDIGSIEAIASHKQWADMIMDKYDITADNCEEILQKEIGIVFTSILEQCGVYSRNDEGKAGFIKFIESVK